MSGTSPHHPFHFIYKCPTLCDLLNDKLSSLILAPHTHTFQSSSWNPRVEIMSSSMESPIEEKGGDLWRKLIVESHSCSSSSQLQLKKQRVPTKRKPGFDRSVTPRRPCRNAMERKMRILKKLVPNCTETTGVEGLFRETADYIVALQTRIKVMQTMVSVLSGSDDDAHH